MMRLGLAGAILLLSQSASFALPDGYIDPSNISLKVGKLQIEGKSEATVNFTVVNNSKMNTDIIAVTCTALIADDPVETNSTPVGGVAAGQTAYASVHFFKVKGDASATASCRVQYVKTE